MIYWSNRNSIGDAEQDGRDPQILVKGPTVDSPAGVALDGPEIYWANHGNNSIAEANLRGDADARIPVRGPDVNKPRGVAVYGDPIYWVNQGSSEIKEVDLEGHGARTVVHRDTAKGPYGLAVTGG